MPMIERREQTNVTRQQHAVAEHIARHVADADARELGRLRIDAELAKVPLDALPRAARGNRPFPCGRNPRCRRKRTRRPARIHTRR